MNAHIYDALVHERMRDALASAERVRRVREALRAAAEQAERVRFQPPPRHEEIEAEELVLAGHR